MIARGPSVRGGVALSVLPGWLLVAGTAGSTALFDIVDWSSGPFVLALILAVLLIRMSDHRQSQDLESSDAAPHGWFSNMAAVVRIDGRTLTAASRAAGLDPRGVALAARLPWWLLAGFWVFLVANAAIQFAIPS